MDRDADGAGLVGDGPGDGLADPPGGVGRELEALRVVELLDGPHEAEVALLDQVEEGHAPADVALGDRDDEAEVGLGELLLGELAVTDDCEARRQVASGSTHSSGSIVVAGSTPTAWSTASTDGIAASTGTVRRKRCGVKFRCAAYANATIASTRASLTASVIP